MTLKHFALAFQSPLREYNILFTIGKSGESSYVKPSLYCLKHKSPRFKPHNSVACRALTNDHVFAQFGNLNYDKAIMVEPPPNQDTRLRPLATEQVRQMISSTMDSLNVQYGNLSAQLKDLKTQFKEIILLLQGKINETGSKVNSLSTKVNITQQSVADLSK
ncbi:hypothetical protein ACLB2K_030604 [Fragaria x ananassa]